jgi:hypothetical protein
MKLSLLLRLHDSVSSHLGAESSLGDAYLCEKNHCYRAMRQLALKHGAKLTCDHEPLSALYQCLPLLSLEEILDRNSIPYRDNVSPLRALVASGRDFDAPLDFLLSDFRRNYLLHESAHCLAHQLLCEGQPSRALVALDPAGFHLLSLVGEAFANSLETFALAWSADAAGAVFFTLNTYCTYSHEQLRLVSSSTKALGLRGALELAIWSYFAAHSEPTATALPSGTGAMLRDIAFELGFESVGATAAAEQLAHMAFNLDPGFRATTSPAYFRYLGLPAFEPGLAPPKLDLSASREDPRCAKAIKQLVDHFVDALERDTTIEMRSVG